MILLDSLLHKKITPFSSVTTLLIFFSLAGFAQYPVLTKVISFETLQSKAVEIKLTWTNPDSTSEDMTITEMAIPVDDLMKQKTKEFLRVNYKVDSIWMAPRAIVLHAMGDGSLQTSLEISSFLNDEIPSNWGSLSKAGKLPNGAHFIVEENGHVICLTPPLNNDGSHPSYERKAHRWIVKRHQDGNPMAIGIENVTKAGDLTGLTIAQKEANAKLVRWLVWMERGKIEFLTSHHQFNSDRFCDSFLARFGLRHLQKEYRTRGRKDVGEINLKEIHAKVNEFGVSVSLFE